VCPHQQPPDTPRRDTATGCDACWLADRGPQGSRYIFASLAQLTCGPLAAPSGCAAIVPFLFVCMSVYLHCYDSCWPSEARPPCTGAPASAAVSTGPCRTPKPNIQEIRMRHRTSHMHTAPPHTATSAARACLLACTLVRALRRLRRCATDPLPPLSCAQPLQQQRQSHHGCVAHVTPPPAPSPPLSCPHLLYASDFFVRFGTCWYALELGVCVRARAQQWS
jgi:hypothetical protein